MRTLYGFPSRRVSPTPVICTFGTFDGIHMGHRFVLDRARRLAQDQQGLLAVVSLTRPNLPFLSSPSKKKALLEEAGVDIHVEIQFSDEVRTLSPEAFLARLEKAFSVSGWVQGQDTRFGRDRRGDVDFLSRHARGHAQECLVLDRLEKFSSTRIRQYISVGAFSFANDLLGRPYSIDFQARTLPTVRARIGTRFLYLEEPNMCLPPSGQYPSQIHGLHTCARGTCTIFPDEFVLEGCAELESSCSHVEVIFSS